MRVDRVLLIEGHPDTDPARLNHALAEAYADGARSAGIELRRTVVGALDFPLLASQRDWEQGSLPPSLAQAQADLAWAQHIVLFFPLWLGDMPAKLKAFLEQVARPGFAFGDGEGRPFARKGLSGRSARVVVTMGMPALLYRWVFRAHSVKALERNILGFMGLAPVHETLIGRVEQLDEADVQRWLARMRRMGEEGI